jgi:cation diffusion facilitator family transporter
MKAVAKAMSVSIAVNVMLVITKFIVGIITNYKSMIADAIHSFSDFSTDVVAIFGQKLAIKKEDINHPYGHGKIEYITSIIIGTVIMFLGLGLLKSIFAEEKVLSTQPVIALIVVAFTIVSKYVLAKYVKHIGKKENNSILIASAQENMADVLSSIGVFIAIVLSLFEKYVPIFKYADKAGSAIISILIIKTAYNILKDNITAIIGESEQDEEVIYQIKGIVMSVQEVLSIDNLVVMKFGSYYQIQLDAGVDSTCSLEGAHEIAHCIEKELLDSELKIKYVTVHINPYKKNTNFIQNNE